MEIERRSLKTITRWLILVLLVSTIMQTILVCRLVLSLHQNQERHALLPLLTCLSCLKDQEPVSSWDLESMDLRQETIRQALFVLGAPITLEDLIRGIHVMLERDSSLSTRQKKELLGLCETAHDVKNQLLENETQIRTYEQELSSLASKAVALLDPRQLAELIANRDRDSVIELEDIYWREVIAALRRDQK